MTIIVKKQKDYTPIVTRTCGALTEILAEPHVTPAIALVRDIRVTVPHFHREFEELYWVLDGEMTIRLYEPDERRFTDVELRKHELCVIRRGVHHQVARSSYENLLCALSVPYFEKNDETPSDVTGWTGHETKKERSLRIGKAELPSRAIR